MSAPLEVDPSLERYRCATCEYVISVTRAPSHCPMCGGRSWKPEPDVPLPGRIQPTGTSRFAAS